MMEATLTLHALFEPEVVISFPPDGFTFFRGVKPFFRVSLEVPRP